DGGERQLGIVGVLPPRVALDLEEAPQQRRARRQLVVPVALERSAQGVSDGAAEEAAKETVPQVGRRRNHGRPSLRALQRRMAAVPRALADVRKRRPCPAIVRSDRAPEYAERPAAASAARST